MPDPISWSFSWPYLVGALLGGYLLGSIPFGLLATRLAGLGDIRRIGSGNIGFANVLRTGNKAVAVATLLLDGGKGAAAVLLAGTYGPDATVMAGAGAILGHCFPVWLGFRGGKGVATALGVLLGLMPVVGLLACATYLAVAFTWRYSSLASLSAVCAAPVYAYLLSNVALAGDYLADPQKAELAIVIAAVVVARHHANIRRLMRGQEPKFGQRPPA